MEAFTSYHGRRTRIMGSMGDMVGDMEELVVNDFRTGKQVKLVPKAEDVDDYRNSGHGGGDWGLARDFAQADGVDLVGGEIGGGVIAEERVVISRSVGEAPHAVVGRGDRLLALFDGPARAIRCASAITEYASRLGLETRAGLHTGECEMVNGKVAGVAAQMGVCVVQEAAVGEVLVSSTVKDLVAGSGIAFEDRGIHDLKDCGEWRLFAVQK